MLLGRRTGRVRQATVVRDFRLLEIVVQLLGGAGAQSTVRPVAVEAQRDATAFRVHVRGAHANHASRVACGPGGTARPRWQR